ncbi:MAG: S-methyl-5-thioribose-1-phosphate isomerase, partial [Peptostreptococcaceae bacterium]
MTCIELERINAVMLDDVNNAMILLDQTKLPNEKLFIRLTGQNEIWEAIFELKVRGAPAIGVAAGYGVYLGTKASKATNFDELYKDFIKSKDYLASSRPTAVNLFWALNRMEQRLLKEKDKNVDEIKNALREEADNIREEDIQICKSIGVYGASLLKDGMGILTHCNAGAIATAGYGTALSPIYIGTEQGMKFKVFADETRPLL